MRRLRGPEGGFGRAGLVVGVLALVLALVGGAWAASGGLTVKQKKEVKKIAQKFAGKQGPVGAPGKDGAPGAPGKDGAPGPPGPLLETLESGQAETGFWNYFDPEKNSGIANLSYPFRLAAPIATEDIVVLALGEEETTDCPGTLEEPQAAKGKLCLYQAELAPETEVTLLTTPFYPTSHTTGAAIALEGPGGNGSWAVTAP